MNTRVFDQVDLIFITLIAIYLLVFIILILFLLLKEDNNKVEVSNKKINLFEYFESIFKKKESTQINSKIDLSLLFTKPEPVKKKNNKKKKQNNKKKSTSNNKTTNKTKSKKKK